MKVSSRIISLMLICLFSSCVLYIPYEEGGPPPERPRYAERGYRDYPSRVDIAFFYEYLSPYGVWIFYAPHGYVWIPRQTPYRWRPYTYGRWVWTDHGWTWISQFEWGWIPFHYGRWGFDTDLGWFWVPDTVWAPAWVAWRWSDLYIGWAPLPPGVRFFAGVGISSLPVDLPHHYWIFIEGRYFFYSSLDRYVLPDERNLTLVRYTVSRTSLSLKNDRIVNEGIDIDQIRRVTRREVTRYELKDATRPGSPWLGEREVALYRPSVAQNELAKPKTILSREEAKEKISKVSIREERGRIYPLKDESRIREEQERERRLLERSQEREISQLKRKIEEEKRLAQAPSEKERIEKDYEVKTSELKKRHEEEKAELRKRQQKESEEVKKKKIKKDDQ